jgi:uncharacterized protein (TIGR03435 family)
MDMDRFAARLAAGTDLDVFDATGLDGTYTFRLEFSPDSSTPGFGGGVRGLSGSPSGPSDAGPSIFSALEEQIGLRLESAKGTSQLLVIDYVARLSDN